MQMCLFTRSVTITVKCSLYMMDLMIKINHEQYDKVTGAVDFIGKSRESTLTKYLLHCL